MLTACVYPLEDQQGDSGEVRGSFALSLKNVDVSKELDTKMSGSVVQSDGSFRGIDQVYVVPFHTDGGSAVSAGDERLGSSNVDLHSLGISSNGLIGGNNAHLFDVVIMPSRMNRVLVYGKACDEMVSAAEKVRKQRNGVLNPVNLNDPSLSSDISFSLESILNETESSDMLSTADRLIASLNDVVSAIRQSGEASFNNIFEYAENQIWACSYQTFFSILENLQSVLFGYHGTGSESIMVAVDALSACMDEVGSDFPTSYGVPEGAVGFWWNGKEFRRLISGVNINLVPLERFSFPPSLWYYANSPVQTSNDDKVISEYKPENESWSAILGHYGDGGTVLYSTRSVATNQQLQYGVGMLALRLSGNDIDEVRGCPLTGVIIGDQSDVDFEFKPKASVSNEESIKRYVYDKVSGGPSLGTASSTSIPTLLLQTDDEANVHFVLEFMNTTTRTLSCQQGDILPGCRFYVAGILDPSLNTVVHPSGQTTLTRVFSQDRMTSVTVSVTSLINAYNTVPDLYDPQLEVGIVAEMNWIPVTPQSIKLNL